MDDGVDDGAASQTLVCWCGSAPSGSTHTATTPAPPPVTHTPAASTRRLSTDSPPCSLTTWRGGASSVRGVAPSAALALTARTSTVTLASTPTWPCASSLTLNANSYLPSCVAAPMVRCPVAGSRVKAGWGGPRQA